MHSKKCLSLILMCLKIVICEKILSIQKKIDPSINISKCSNFIKESNFEVLALQVSNRRMFVGFEFSNIRSFTQLNLSCLLSDRIYFRKFKIVSKNMLILDNNLKIDFDQKYLSNNTYFKIANIKGIDILSSPFHSISAKTELSIVFFFTYFLLFLNESEIRECSRDNFNAFKNINSIKFSIYVKYYHETCPFIFFNLSNLAFLEFHGISDIFLKKNYLSFIEVNETIDLKVNFLLFNFYKFKLNKRLFSVNLFQKVNNLYLKGNIEEAESDCLFAFGKLSWLNIDFFNLDALLSRNSEWLFNYLNQVENDLFVEFFSPDLYQFPDEDICLFRKFPKNRPIFPILPAQSCSCTIIWILQNDNQSRKNKINELNENLCSNKTCDFDQMISKCVKPKWKKFVPNEVDFLFDTSKIAFINLILFPLFSMLGIFMNSINVWILSGNKKEENIKNPVYKQMIINSILNFIYCFIYFFHIINVCIFFTGFFCSQFNRSVLAQIYDIYFVEFFGNILKTLSNFLMAMISLDRYFLLQENMLLEKLYSKWKKVRFIFKMLLIFLIFSAMVYLHSVRILTSKINNFNNFVNEYFYYKDFPIKYFFKPVSHLERIFSNEIEKNFMYLYIIFIVDFVLNDLILYILIVTIDLLLIFQLKSIFDRKINLFKFFDEKKIMKIEKNELNIRIGLFLNLFVLLILRMLEFGISIYVFFGILINSNCRQLPQVCTNFLDLGKLFYLLSCSQNTIVYCFLSESFRKRLILFLQNMKKKFF